MDKLVAGVTGHRMQRIGWNNKNRMNLAAEKAILDNRETIDHVILGMAVGWDQAVAKACVKHDVPFIAAVPFVGQEKVWPEHAQREYHELLEKAMAVAVTSLGGYSPAKLMIRNKWIIDRSGLVLAAWDGTESGGTWNAIQQANSSGIPVINYWGLITNSQFHVEQF